MRKLCTVTGTRAGYGLLYCDPINPPQINETNEMNQIDQMNQNDPTSAIFSP